MFSEFQLDLFKRLQMINDAIPEGGTDEEKKLAFERIGKKLDTMPKECRITLHSCWEKRLLEALCKQHGLRTYRYPRQRDTTLMIWVSEVYLNEILWPQFLNYAHPLQDYFVAQTSALVDKIRQEVPKQSGAQMGPPPGAIALSQ